ncbi:MAG: DNA-binding protein WhiA [Candidatus Eremiobacteraeota bacterium]|nr:DNA-binding protein WhiA [Candidatus Eremiobacteraeota bacterium]MBV9263936.1 DNA-binding protein WhiA [Candidatus Eremiobacteraeota bacterium]
MAVISPDAKDALAREIPAEAHCRQALLAGLALYGRVNGEFVTHRNAIARLFWSLLEDRKRHPIESRAPTRLHRLPTFAIALPPQLRGVPPKSPHKCDRLMEVRSAFLACGTVAAGAQGYHLEFAVRGEHDAARLSWTLRSVAAAPKQTRRKKHIVLYFKDFEAIVEVLTRIGAFGAVLQLEDVRALRETKNRIHRLVNTEAANLQRCAQAAAAQCNAIEYLHDVYGLPRLSPALREIAELRLAHPEESLAELGRRCNPPIAKASVSGRLAAIGRLVASLRGVQGSAKPVR